MTRENKIFFIQAPELINKEDTSKIGTAVHCSFRTLEYRSELKEVKK